MIEAFARSKNAEEPVWRDVQAGDTCVITVTAQDKSERKYYIHFALSQLNDALEPTSNDILIKRIPGSFRIFVGTIRQGVTFALFDHNGSAYYRAPIAVPAADANNAEVIPDAEDHERLNDVYDLNAGLLIDLEPGKIYLYGVYADNDKKCLKSGKLLINK